MLKIRNVINEVHSVMRTRTEAKTISLKTMEIVFNIDMRYFIHIYDEFKLSTNRAVDYKIYHYDGKIELISCLRNFEIKNRYVLSELDDDEWFNLSLMNDLPISKDDYKKYLEIVEYYTELTKLYEMKK